MRKGPSKKLLCIQGNLVTQPNNLRGKDTSEMVVEKSHNAVLLTFLTFFKICMHDVVKNKRIIQPHVAFQVLELLLEEI